MCCAHHRCQWPWGLVPGLLFAAAHNAVTCFADGGRSNERDSRSLPTLPVVKVPRLPTTFLGVTDIFNNDVADVPTVRYCTRVGNCRIDWCCRYNKTSNK